jgi:hypothetical protein
MITGPTSITAQVLAEPAAKAARAIDSPHEIKAILDFLRQGKGRQE